MDVIEGKIKWIDIAKPTKHDVAYLRTLHDFHPLILDELLHVSERAKVEQYDSYLYLTYHFPVYNPEQRTSRRSEIDFLITKDTLITVHAEPLEPLAIFARHLNDHPRTKTQIFSSGGYLLYYILQEFNTFSLRQLRHIEQNVISVTKNLFTHQEYRLLQRISFIKRDILDYGVIAKPQSMLLHSLRDVGTTFWDKDLKTYFTDLIGEHSKVTQQLENFRDTIESCEETNSQLLNAKTNAVMQRFTILAFLTFPMMLYTSIFSVNTVSAFFSDPSDFWVGLGVVFFVTLCTIYIFQRKGLLQD